MTDLRKQWVPGGTRAEASRATLDSLATARFEKIWPDVAPRLIAMLRGMKVASDRGEDLVQEAAIRVLLTRVRYDDADDLFRWASVVVRRLAIDVWRQEQRLTDDAALVARPSVIDVEHEVERRAALDAVLEAWPSLSERDRRTIVLAVEERAVALDEAVAVHSARYRAREKLRAAIRGVLAWLGWSHGRALRRPAAGVVAPLVVASFVLPLVIGSLSSPPTDRQGPAETGFERVSETPSSTSETAPGAHEPTVALERRIRARIAPSPRPTRFEREIPSGHTVYVEHDPAATGPLLCANPGPPVGEQCVPTLPPLPTAMPTP